MTEAAEPKPLVINGWYIFAHPLFLDQLEELAQKVEVLKKREPKEWMKKNSAKRLAAVTKVAFELIPQDPTHAQFRQGDSLGDEYKHWFRARFLQQYRLFFRYHAETRTILLAWVNDEDTKRAYGSDTDAYKVGHAGESMRCRSSLGCGRSATQQGCRASDRATRAWRVCDTTLSKTSNMPC